MPHRCGGTCATAAASVRVSKVARCRLVRKLRRPIMDRGRDMARKLLSAIAVFASLTFSLPLLAQQYPPQQPGYQQPSYQAAPAPSAGSYAAPPAGYSQQQPSYQQPSQQSYQQPSQQSYQQPSQQSY